MVFYIIILSLFLSKTQYKKLIIKQINVVVFLISDIDECATDTHNCNHIGQKCQNTAGGFKCKCEDGFLPVGAYCAGKTFHL